MKGIGSTPARRLAAVAGAAGLAAGLSVAGCSSQPAFRQVVEGRLVVVGGPSGSVVPISGTIQAHGPGGQVLAAKAGRDGRFRLSLAPGSYRLTGRSPAIQDGKLLCAADRPVRVTRKSPVRGIKVACLIR